MPSRAQGFQTAVLLTVLSLSCPLLFGCPALQGEVDEGDPPPPPTPELVLSESSVHAALPALSRAMQRPIVVAPEAMSRARCPRLSIVTPAGTPSADLVAMLSAALEPSGLQLDVQPSGTVVRHTAAEPTGGGCEVSRRLSRPGLPRRSRPRPDRTSRFDDGERARIAAGIARVGEREWVMTPDARSALLEGEPPRVTEEARLIPGPEGMAVYGVRRAGMPSVLGLQSGDRIQTIAGRPVTVDSMSSISAELLTAERTEVQLLRRGQSRTHVYRVVRRLPAARWERPGPSRP
ncbi:MAG: hypothetical protein AB8I08_29855 [Sandaracinaceae bacterium]